MISQQSTAGRHESYPYETNDCTVVALAHAADIPYVEAHKLAASAGRRMNHGMRRGDIKTMLRNLDISGLATIREIPVEEPKRAATSDYLMNHLFTTGYRIRGYRRPRRQGVTVAQFIRTLPKQGRFYLGCTTHAFAYVDGVILDNLERPKARATMFHAYEVIPAKSTPVPTPAITQAQINELSNFMTKLFGDFRS